MSIVSLSPTQSEAMQALRVNLLQQVLPKGSAMFQGSASGTTLTVTKLTTGLLAAQDALFGAGILPGTKILAQLTGPGGGLGTYKLDTAQDVSGVPLNTGVPVIQGQGNRVAQPPAQAYVIMTPLGKPRLATNIDSSADCYFQASLASDGTMVVAEVAYGEIEIGSQVFGVGVADGTLVLSGPDDGGVGAYAVSVPQTVSLQGMACGTQGLLQKAELRVQLDFFGPGGADYAQMVSTVFRDSYGVSLLAASGLPISPLHADDPKQSPFVDGEQQYENRWMVEAVLQLDQTLRVPQQYASVVAVGVQSVEADYPI